MSRSTSPLAAAAALVGAPLTGAAGCGGGVRNDLHVLDPTEGSEPLPGKPSASDDDSDCGTPGAR